MPDFGYRVYACWLSALQWRFVNCDVAVSVVHWLHWLLDDDIIYNAGSTYNSLSLACVLLQSGHVTVQSQRAAVHRPVTPTASQKYVLVAPPQSATAGRAGATQPLASSTSTVMRMMTPTCSAAAAPTKLVVVTVHSAAETATHSSLTPTYSSDTSII